MKKEEILRTLESFPYDKSEYWLITGAAMVLFGMREETGDIDLGCTEKMADELEKEGNLYRRTENGRRWFRYSEAIEIFEEWKTGPLVSCGDLQLLSPEGLIAMKEELGREKDLRDIALIREWLSERKAEK